MRSLVASVVVLALVAALTVAAPPKSHQLEGYTFEDFVDDFGRNYEGEEYDKRRQLFDDRMSAIKAHNAGGHAFRMGVNQFADRTDEEKLAHNKYHPLFSVIAEEEKDEDEEADPGWAKSPILRKVPNTTHTPLPRQVDYREWSNPQVLTAVKNQGHCGSCWAFSAAESIESIYALNFGDLPILSVQQIASCTDLSNGCGGGNFFRGWDYAADNNDLNEEFVYSYTDFFANDSKRETAVCRNITKDWLPNWGYPPKARVLGSVIVQTNSPIAAMEALAHVGPISVSVHVDSAFSHYEGGILTYNASAAVWTTNHAVQLVGYGHSVEHNMNYWIVRNSWGTDWGEQGYIRLERPDEEPCGTAKYGNSTWTSCGVAAVLSHMGYPLVGKVPRRQRNKPTLGTPAPAAV